MARPSARLPPSVTTAFVACGIAILALLAWALSLRTENARLRAELGEPVSTPAGGAPQGGVTPESPSAPADTRPQNPSAPATLDPAVRTALVTQLRAIQSTDKRVWLTMTYGDPRAASFAREIGAAFEEAGYTIARSDVSRFPVRPGLYFMMADAEPPQAVQDILAALEGTGMSVTSGRGYRAFYDERRAADPNWNGFPMDPDQPFVLAIGRIE